MKIRKWLLLAVALYLGAACTVYRLRNPQLTETELFLRLPAAVMWKKA